MSDSPSDQGEQQSAWEQMQGITMAYVRPFKHPFRCEVHGNTISVEAEIPAGELEDGEA